MVSRTLSLLLVVLACICLFQNPVLSFAQEDGFDDEEMARMKEAVGGVDPSDLGVDMYGGGEDGYGGYGGYGDPYGGGGHGGKPPAPQVLELESEEEVTDFIKKHDTFPVVIGYFNTHSGGDEDQAQLDVFTKVSEAEGYNFRFAYSTDKDVLAKAKISKSAIFLYKPSRYVSEKHDKPRSRFPSKSATESTLTSFLHDKWAPLVGQKNRGSETATADGGDVHANTHELYELNNKMPEVTVFASIGNTKTHMKEFNYFANRIRKYISGDGNNHKDVVFNIADKHANKKELKSDYGVKNVAAVLDKHNDVVFGLRHGNMFYSLTPANVAKLEGGVEHAHKFHVDTLDKFLKAYAAGELKGKAKSEGGEDGEDVDDSNVVHLSDANADEVLSNPAADIMVEFYAPWCGHCKHLKPEYAELANTFAEDKSVVIAAMDATANQIPNGYSVEGYPTLYFLPANTKKPVSYEGARTADAIEEYIRQHKTV